MAFGIKTNRFLKVAAVTPDPSQRARHYAQGAEDAEIRAALEFYAERVDGDRAQAALTALDAMDARHRREELQAIERRSTTAQQQELLRQSADREARLEAALDLAAAVILPTAGYDQHGVWWTRGDGVMCDPTSALVEVLAPPHLTDNSATLDHARQRLRDLAAEARDRIEGDR